jgi:Holliday junction resolvasome RuvABC DNA-binding subunit
MANDKMIRGALGMVMPPSMDEDKPMGKHDEGMDEKPSIHDDPEAMEALKVLKDKGYDPEEIEEALHGGHEEEEDMGFKAGLRKGMDR